MKKTLLASSVILALGTAGPASAAFTGMTAGMYTMEITGGCFDFGDCVTLGTGALTDNTTAAQATFSGFGSGIVNDGLVGVIGFTMDDRIRMAVMVTVMVTSCRVTSVLPAGT
jgi:hypothetical protein